LFQFVFNYRAIIDFSSRIGDPNRLLFPLVQEILPAFERTTGAVSLSIPAVSFSSGYFNKPTAMLDQDVFFTAVPHRPDIVPVLKHFLQIHGQIPAPVRHLKENVGGKIS